MLPSFQLVGGAAIAGLLLGAVPTWFLTSTFKDAVWKSSILEQQVEAAKVLKDATDRAASVERANVIFSQQIESEHYEHEKKRAALQRSNRELAAELGGLRDPGHRESRDGTVPPASTGSSIAASPAPAGTLSASAQEFLFVITTAADAVEDYASACYRFVNGVPIEPVTN